MANLSGFQSNTTIHAAFWIYKPDPLVDPSARQQFVEVNSLQFIEATPQQILGNATSVQITNNVLTLTLSTSSGIRPGQALILSGFTNATFLNRAVINVTTVVNQTTITAQFTNANYGPTSEPTGAIVSDATSRKVWLYYDETNVSTSQHPRELVGPSAALFVYDMEVLFA